MEDQLHKRQLQSYSGLRDIAQLTIEKLNVGTLKDV
jgi:hypothetical protein